MIKLEQFSCGYDGRRILGPLDLEISGGSITVVIGQNGSGKSTLAEVLAGLKTDFSGKVWLDDLRLKRSTPIRALRQKLGMVLQNPDHQILIDRAETEISFALQNLNLPTLPDLPKNRHEREAILKAKRREIVRSALAQVGLANKIDINPRELSGGQRQRLVLASVLALQPKYLVLDEATSMLDLPSRQAIYGVLQKLKQQGVGILLMTNLLDEILLADKVLILAKGQIYQYMPAEIIKQPRLLTKYNLATPLLLQAARSLGVANLTDLQRSLSKLEEK